MRSFFLSTITTAPKGARSLAAQLGFFFTITFIILLVISQSISAAYTKVLQQDRSDLLQSTAVVGALSLAHTSLSQDMTYPLPLNNLDINVYKKAGNSFLLIYTTQTSDTQVKEEQVTLTGADEVYTKAFDQQLAAVTKRTDKSGSYVTGIAPIMGADDIPVGLFEVVMPVEEFNQADSGVTLSWVFTIVSIAVALTIVYYQIHKLLQTMLTPPDRMLPKIIRYGLSGCQSIAFFAAMAAVMPVLIIPNYLGNPRLIEGLPESIPPQGAIFAASFLVLWGIFGLHGLKESLVKSLTTRVSLVAFVLMAFIFMILATIFHNPIIFILLMLPVGFSLGMVFYFQREYRIYAGRLGYENFTEKVIHYTQYTGYILGGCVGAVITGVVLERFGMIAVAIVAGLILILMAIQALVFVQHCPASAEPPLTLPSYLYALSSKKSGTFLWSTIMPMGIQLAFFLVFLPGMLERFSLSLATIAFYYILFAFMSGMVVQFLLRIFPGKVNIKGRILFSALLQIGALALLGVMPTAKTLVISVILLGVALGLHEFRFAEYYSNMIREDKKPMSRRILEKTFSLGLFIGALSYSGLLFTDLTEGGMSIGILSFTFVMAIVLLAYPLVTLFFLPTKPDKPSHSRPFDSEVPQPEGQRATTTFQQSRSVNPDYPYPANPNQAPIASQNDANAYGNGFRDDPYQQPWAEAAYPGWSQEYREEEYP